MDIGEKYFVETKPVKTKPGCWDYLEVSIFQKQEDGSKVKIGEYLRHYHTLMRTFHPFVQKGKEYALYSEDYTCTYVMELPSCKKIAGEKPDGNGFCPVDFYVPTNDEHKEEDSEEIKIDGLFGFIGGTVWGDDWSWKVEFLDLSQIEQGIITRTAKFGYFPYASGMRLKEAINMEDYYTCKGKEGKIYEGHNIFIVPCGIRFDMRKDYSSMDYSVLYGRDSKKESDRPSDGQ
jgi:hypothetical protein